MTAKCQYHMCDGSGWRDVGWHLLTPCYCEAGHANRLELGAPQRPGADLARPLDTPIQLAEKVARFPRIQKAGAR